MILKRAVFLDRDGVINKVILQNHRPHPPNKMEDFEYLPLVDSVLQQLKQRGYLLFIVTNQPDISRIPEANIFVETIHNKISKDLPITKIYTCPHDDHNHCTCRKPKPGMILQAAREYNIDLSKSWMVGDRWRDIEAGQNAGCKTILVGNGYKEKEIIFDYKIDSLTSLLDLC